VEDVEALLKKTDAQIIFGISSGANIWLQTALNNSAIHKIVLYDPALFVNGSAPINLAQRYEKENN
jgi:predicted alpha/beta superfamily hydrolase